MISVRQSVGISRDSYIGLEAPCCVSLTSLLKDATMRHRFDTIFEFQPYNAGAKILVPMPDNRPAVGMTFNYLAMFWLKY